MSWLSSIFGDANARAVARFRPVVDSINTLEEQTKALSDEQALKDAGQQVVSND